MVLRVATHQVRPVTASPKMQKSCHTGTNLGGPAFRIDAAPPGRLLFPSNFLKVGEFMPEVIVRKGEPIDRALKRLKSKLDAEGLMDEVRRLRAFETPTQRSRRKAKNNAKRAKMKIRFNFNPVS
jgi:small subunit ribosomal protein S21